VRHRIQLLGYDGFIAQLGRREHTISTEEKNKAVVCRFLEAQSKGDLEALDELLAPDFVDHGLLPFGIEARKCTCRLLGSDSASGMGFYSIALSISAGVNRST
jgi:hypothetical protein